MAVICGNAGVPVGTETCKLCRSHGCEGYKQATKKDKQWENLQKKDCTKEVDMTEEHKNKIAEMLMNDYDIRPSLAHLIVKVFIESAEQIIKEDSEIINTQIKE